MNYLPHRYRPQSVYRFIPILSRLCQPSQTPTALTFNPSELGISVETAMARLRDASHALSTGLTTHPSIDASTLSAVWPLYKVTSDGTNVVVSLRNTEKGTPAISVCTADSYVLRADAEGFVEALTAFAVLLGKRYLTGRVTVQGTIPHDLFAELSANHDIAFQVDQTTNTTTMI